MTFLELAKKLMKEEEKPLSAEEIWVLAKEKGYDKIVGSQGKTPSHTIGAQIYVSLQDKENTPFVKVSVRPTRFYLKSLSMPKGYEPPAPKPKKFNYLENDLYPYLTYYASLYLKAYTKTIQHTKSSRTAYGEWVHPDMVGCYFPIEEWDDTVFELSSAIGNISIKLFSFEIKRELTFSNLREAFFQTVSNSSWANESYLVAAEISEDNEFRAELQRLSTSFGIGIINLNLDEPDSSEILYPANTKEYLDWDAINKLTNNPDFQEFLKRIKTDLTSKEIRKEQYDKVLTKEEINKISKRIS